MNGVERRMEHIIWNVFSLWRTHLCCQIQQYKYLTLIIALAFSIDFFHESRTLNICIYLLLIYFMGYVYEDIH